MKKGTYYQQHKDELFHYLWLKPEITGVTVDIFVDDGGTYKIDQHSLLAFVRNGHSRGGTEFVAVAVEGNQEVLSVGVDVMISPIELLSVKAFLKENQILLKELADEEKDHQEFFSNR